MRSVVRTLTASTLAGATIVAATGWLYAVHGRVHGWPGPGVRDALALDELPHRADGFLSRRRPGKLERAICGCGHDARFNNG